MWRQWSNITRLFGWATCSTAPLDREEDINDGVPNSVKGKRITSKKLFRRRHGSIDFGSQSHEQQTRNSSADDHENTTSSRNDSRQGFWAHFADDKDENEDEDGDYIVEDGKSEPSNSLLIIAQQEVHGLSIERLSCEWIGSPVPMPKSQGLLHDLRKHKLRSLIKHKLRSLLTCRF